MIECKYYKHHLNYYYRGFILFISAFCDFEKIANSINIDE